VDINIHFAVCKHVAGLLWMRIACQIACVGSLLIWPLTPVLPKAAIGCGSSSPHNRIGYTSLARFVFAYALVMTEKLTQLRKSEPVTLARASYGF
jgi:hypothetical protein